MRMVGPPPGGLSGLFVTHFVYGTSLMARPWSIACTNEEREALLHYHADLQSHSACIHMHITHL